MAAKGVLDGVVAFVDVRTENGNLSNSISAQIVSLGGSRVDKFTAAVTHVIFKDGSKATFEKAVKKSIPLLSVLWIEECKKRNTRAPEEDFQLDKDAFKDGMPPKRAAKCMTPQPLDASFDLHASSVSHPNSNTSSLDDVPLPPNFSPVARSTPHKGSVLLCPETQAASSTSASASINASAAAIPPTPGCSEDVGSAPLFEDDTCNYEEAVSQELVCSATDPAAAASALPEDLIMSSMATATPPSRSQRPQSPVVTAMDEEEEEQNTDDIFGTTLKTSPAAKAATRTYASKSAPRTSPGKQEAAASKAKENKAKKRKDGDEDAATEAAQEEKKVPEDADMFGGEEDDLMDTELLRPVVMSPSKGKATAQAEAEKAEKAAPLEVEKAAQGEEAAGGKKPKKTTTAKKTKASDEPEPTASTAAVEEPKTKKAKEAKETKEAKEAKEAKGAKKKDDKKGDDKKDKGPEPMEVVETADDVRPVKKAKVTKTATADTTAPATTATTAADAPPEESKRKQPAKKTAKKAAAETTTSSPAPEAEAEAGSSSDKENADGATKKKEKKAAKAPELKPKKLMDEQPAEEQPAEEQPAEEDGKSKPKKKTKKTSSVSSSQQQQQHGDMASGDAEAANSASSEDSSSNGSKAKTVQKEYTPVRSKGKKDKGVIVLTGLSSADREIVIAAIHHLGGYVLARDGCIDETTTHCVTNGGRTLKVLESFARGCWVVSAEWVLKSLEQGSWLDEEPFERVDRLPAARMMRAERQKKGLGKVYSTLLEGKTLYISQQTEPARQDLISLVTKCGGTISRSKDNVAVCVGPISSSGGGGGNGSGSSSGSSASDAKVPNVNEKWLIDSIVEQRLMPTADYPVIARAAPTTASPAPSQ